MSRTSIYGFDSAWVDKPTQPGAISSLHSTGEAWDFKWPELSGFSAATARIADDPAEKCLIALDQPTIVTNSRGIRPVERVAGAVINGIKGGVQPASLEKSTMFGSQAPVWGFIESLSPTQNPFLAREQAEGRYLIEVFPALALPSLISKIWKRKLAAKYNPMNRSKFMTEDWCLVCAGLQSVISALPLHGMHECLQQLHDIAKPAKSDQDKLDSLICTLIGFLWLHCGTTMSVVIGDGTTGFMVTPVIDETRLKLAESANRNGVPINAPALFSKTALPCRPPASSQMAAEITVVLPKPRIMPAPHAAQTSKKLEAHAVRDILIQAAKSRRILTYGDVLSPFGIAANSFSVVGRLVPILTIIGRENIRHGEPLLPALVVAKQTCMPGNGFYKLIGQEPAQQEERKTLLAKEQKKVFSYEW